METDGGRWTVFQRRQDGSVNFYKYWVDYENGFGNLTGEFWLGLSKIHRLTQEGPITLRVDLGDFEGNKRYAQYTTFSVGNSATEYTLTVGGYSGTAGDALIVGTNLNGTKFSTRDNDNDNDSGSCAQTWKASWWMNNCFNANLNGPYSQTSSISSVSVGIIWGTWKGHYYSLKFSEMKLRKQN